MAMMTSMTTRLFLALGLACLTLPLHAAPRTALVPGGIAHIPLGPINSGRPEARFGGAPVLVMQEDKRWVAWVGLPLDLKPGTHTVTVKQGGDTAEMPIEVGDKAYPVQHLKVKNRRMVNPDPDDLKRIEREAATQNEVKTLFRDEAQPEIDFVIPVKGRRSSAYGLRRTFNGEPRAPHRGLDIAAARGTPIVAPSGGVVTHVGNFFFNGNTVFIDHGQGLISMFCHMDRVSVEAGSRVRQGEAVGTVGNTGRVTGPHLHWSLFLNGTPVDPALFID